MTPAALHAIAEQYVADNRHQYAAGLDTIRRQKREQRRYEREQEARARKHLEDASGYSAIGIWELWTLIQLGWQIAKAVKWIMEQLREGNE